MEVLYIFIYILLWAIAIVAHFIKRKKIDIGIVLMGSYLIYAITGYFLYIQDTKTYLGLTLLPFIYLFCALFITATPIRAYDVDRIDRIQGPSMKLLNAICLFYIVMTFLSLPEIISNMNILGLLASSENAGLELYQESLAAADEGGQGISNLPAIFRNQLIYLGILFLFYYLTIPQKYTIIKLGLLCTLPINILAIIFNGHRGGVFLITVITIITYFALKKFIPDSINKRIKAFGIIGLLLVTLPIYFITASRFGDKMTESLSDYIGQNSLNFNLYALDDNGIRYGDRTIPIFKKLLGLENVPNNFEECRAKYPKLKVNDEVFYTYVGDFTIDFGPILGGLFLLVMGIIINRKMRVKNRTLLFHQLILLHFMLCVCMGGGLALFPFAYTGNLTIITYFLIYMLFKWNYHNRKTLSEPHINSCTHNCPN